MLPIPFVRVWLYIDLSILIKIGQSGWHSNAVFGVRVVVHCIDCGFCERRLDTKTICTEYMWNPINFIVDRFAKLIKVKWKEKTKQRELNKISIVEIDWLLWH